MAAVPQAPPAAAVAAVARLLRGRRVVVLAGAGVSTESGIPDYRGAGRSPRRTIQYRDFVTSPAIRARYWARSAAGWPRLAAARPNAGHLALAALEAAGVAVGVITQNVDGLHAAAGSRQVVELHGNIARVKCSREAKIVSDYAEDESPPRCPCGAYLRPDVVWFGEMLPAGALARAEAAAERCEVFFSIGTSAEVYPAADLPLRALSAGATVVEINPERTPLTRHAHFALHGPAGKVLPALIEKLSLIS